MDIQIQLFNVLSKQLEVLNTMYNCQQSIRKAVFTRNWQNLETNLITVQTLTERFENLEKERINLFNLFGSEEEYDIYRIIPKFSKENKDKIVNVYHQVRQKLLVCKIENDSLNDYVKITRGFLQGIFDKVIPNRKNVVYASNGIVHNQPNSLVLNTVL